MEVSREWNMDRQTPPYTPTHSPTHSSLFIAGISDHVTCYHCGFGLRNWEEEDQPWIEHARWYPACLYVRVIKGEGFIERVRRERPVPTHLEVEMKKKKLVPAHRAPVVLSERELDLIMDLDVIQAMMTETASTFGRDNVQKALIRHVSQTGRPFSRPLDCIRSVLNVAIMIDASGAMSIDGDEEEEGQIVIPDEEMMTRMMGRRRRNAQRKRRDEKRDRRDEKRDEKTPCTLCQCKVCLEASAEITFLPCGHLSTCATCAMAMLCCPVCRGKIEVVHKTLRT